LLIDRGADIKVKDNNRKIVLYLVVLAYRVNKLLIDKGINLKVKDNNGKTVLYLVISA
ncbi:hypothetical protein P154DRAFT_422301, partial [Amniculicola lignicola CBS 123094]